MSFRASRAQCFAIGRMRSIRSPFTDASIAAVSTSSTLLTSPGMAESGHCVQHWPQPVHFSAMKSGTSSRTPLMSRTAPVAAGIALIAANGSAMPSCPIWQSAHTCSQNRPGLPGPCSAFGESSSIGMCGTLPGSSATSPSAASTACTSSKPRRITRTLSSTTCSPFDPNFLASCLRMPSKTDFSLAPSRASSGDVAKNAPMNAAPCIRYRSSTSDASLRAIANASSTYSLIFRSRMVRRAFAGSVCQNDSGERSLWITKTPPAASPSSGSLCRKTFGSGESTTSTCRSSQLSRIGSCASTA